MTIFFFLYDSDYLRITQKNLEDIKNIVKHNYENLKNILPKSIK